MEMYRLEMMQKRKALLVFDQRVDSLKEDGYRLLFKSTGDVPDVWFASLRHRNGNRVTLAAYWKRNRLVQRTNGIVTHEGSLYQP